MHAEDILWDVAERHLGEAEFMFETREAACDSPLYTLEELASGPDDRLLAHLDALAIPGDVVIDRLLLPTIEDPMQDYEKIVAATLAICVGTPANWWTRLLGLLDSVESEAQRRGLVRALQLCDAPSLQEALVQGLTSVRGPGIAARLDVLAAREAVTGAWLGSFLASDDLEVARAAAGLARHCAEPRVFEQLDRLARSPEPTLQRTTLETVLWRQLGGAWASAVYWAFTPSESPIRRAALIWVALLGDAKAHERILGLLDDERHRADALWAAGFTGRRAAIERCLPLLEHEELGQLAGEVVCEIAGLPTNDERYWRAPAAPSPEQTLPRLEDDNLGADLVPSGAAALPRPEPQEIVHWWRAHEHAIQPSLRYLGGRPLDTQVLLHALAHRPMRRRHNLALELAFRSAGAASVRTWDWAKQQRVQLVSLAKLAPIDLQRGLAP